MTLAPKLVDPASGQLFEWAVGAPISAADAAEQLPLVTRAIHELGRIEAYLRDVVTDDMHVRGQTERRAGDVVYELKAEATWTVEDGGALYAVLHQACARDEITQNELREACQQIVSFKFHHARLTTLAKRVPEIDQHRRRVEGEPRLRVKSK